MEKLPQKYIILTLANSYYSNGYVYGMVNKPSEYDVKIKETAFTTTANH